MFQAIIGMIFSLILGACGSSNGATPAGSSLTAQDASVTQTFAWNDYHGICNALSGWNSTQTNIQFADSASGLTVYLFTNTKITQNGNTLTTFTNNVGAGYPPVCTYYVVNGRLTQVN